MKNLTEQERVSAKPIGKLRKYIDGTDLGIRKIEVRELGKAMEKAGIISIHLDESKHPWFVVRTKLPDLKDLIKLIKIGRVSLKKALPLCIVLCLMGCASLGSVEGQQYNAAFARSLGYLGEKWGNDPPCRTVAHTDKYGNLLGYYKECE